MSTKTTLKRIALVAVSALGFGLLSIIPAKAVSGAATAGASSYTFVGASGGYGLIPIYLTDTTGADAALPASAGTETITVTITGVPNTVDSSRTLLQGGDDLVLGSVTRGTTIGDAGVFSTNTTASSFAETAGNGTSVIESLALKSSAAGSSNNATSGAVNSVYWISVQSTAAAVDYGTYTLRIRLQNSVGFFTQSFVSVKFVSSPADSGAALTISASGNMRTGSTLSYATGSKFSVALADANGGRVALAAASLPTTLSSIAPLINSSVVTSGGLALSTGAQSLTATDDGTVGYDAVTDTADINSAFDGTYGLSGSILSTTAASATNKIKVSYGATAVTKTISILNSTAAAGTGAYTVTGTGAAVIDSANYTTLPLTTTSAKVSVGTTTPGNAISFTVTWNNVATGNVSPITTTPLIVYADATGVASITLTNSAPVDGANAVINVTGFLANPSSDWTVRWMKSKPSSTLSSVDIAGAYVAVGSTNTATITVLDSFGAPVSGVVLMPAWTGINASTTRTYTAVTTNASGQASYTFTDAAATAGDSDTITFKGVEDGVTYGSATVKYAAAAPSVTAITSYYNVDNSITPAYTNVVTAVPTTGIYVDGISKKFNIKVDRNYSKVISLNYASSPLASDGVVLRARVGAKGAKVVVTTSAGAYLLSSANTATASRTLYSDTNGDVFVKAFTTKAGANTITFTAGTVTASAAFWAASADANARFVTLTGPATGTANGALLTYTVAVTDRFGNPMNGQTVSISATGVATLGGGSKISSFTTDATGTFTFTGTSQDSAGGAGTFQVSVPTTNEFASVAGYSSTTAIDSTVAAGNNTASVAVTFAAGDNASTVAANAAADAALEAIDAATAATDAANLAAEAADAATMAAQDAKDAADAATAAVEKLAQDVATMIDALKAQLATLANVVAKIAKKVKA